MKPKGLLPLLLLSLCVQGVHASEVGKEILLGMPESQLIAQKGQPTAKMTVGNKAVYRWADATVTVEEGKVTHIEIRDPKLEKEDAERRAELVAAIAEKKAQKEKEEAAKKAAALAWWNAQPKAKLRMAQHGVGASRGDAYVDALQNLPKGATVIANPEFNYIGGRWTCWLRYERP